METTIGGTIDQLHAALSDYIEATYHISDPKLIDQRHRLLREVGVIHQRPYLESTPRYKTGQAFASIAGLNEAALRVFKALSTSEGGAKVLVHDPPYRHQADAVAMSLGEQARSLLVMTGTGSGKTECFLLPILGKLAAEAATRRDSFRSAAVRAIVLYPMNALVNDQLGRLRLMFGDPRVVQLFTKWAGRPARFARYTSRTLYPGVRDSEKDAKRLKPLRRYYVENLLHAKDPSSAQHDAAVELVRQLQERGKWPAKPDLIKWYGADGTHWQDAKTKRFKRAVALDGDPELVTRHEVQEDPPNVLVTNYSMLEYMLMRPLERPVFDKTREWLAANPNERLLLVLDEAHLYRGASGAEVALLVRRLRMRLGVPAERMQVICTSASFKDGDYAKRFAAQLTGKRAEEFETIKGELHLRGTAMPGTPQDAEVLAQIDLHALYEAGSDAARLDAVRPFVEHRGVSTDGPLGPTLHAALCEFPPLGLLINETMRTACPIDALGERLFPGTESADTSARALTALTALGSLARLRSDEPGLLPCRVHAFYRGLPGLWVCMDPTCSELFADLRGGPTGKLYAHPRDACPCGARVLELFTCRSCGAAYARAYTDDVDEPTFLWGEAGSRFATHSGEVKELEPIDLLLEDATSGDAEPADFDLVTGRLNPTVIDGARLRRVYLRKSRRIQQHGDDEAAETQLPRGEFRPCGVCEQTAGFSRTSVQDHQTKGDQPFQALVTRQLQVQPPSPTPQPTIEQERFAPLRGRKVLTFSDSRQTAARLAPNLQTYSTRDALRPILVVGVVRLQKIAGLRKKLSLHDLYLAVLLAARDLRVRLRPQLRQGEVLRDDKIDDAQAAGGLDDAALTELVDEFHLEKPPEALLRDIVTCLTDKYYGLEALALASIMERGAHTAKLDQLSHIPGVATTPDAKRAWARAWLRTWHRQSGCWISHMPDAWMNTEVRGHPSGKLQPVLKLLDKPQRTLFEQQWLPTLLKEFTEPYAAGRRRLRGSELSLDIGGAWAYCDSCRSPQRPLPGSTACIVCSHGQATPIDPDADPIFRARKGYYRRSTSEALRDPPIPPIALIAAEHTAQIGAAMSSDVFSKAEENELLFQDVNLGPDETQRERPAIDVLSCTTTMEVGIDIGSLSGVALRNMPPARANYQQRAGRAGRRGNAIATVIAFGSADSHDEHYFSSPDAMIRGDVDDPKLTLDNFEITRRHVTAYLLQRYHQERVQPGDQVPPNLFAVLGTVRQFRDPTSVLSRDGFAAWLAQHESALRDEVAAWVPSELGPSERQRLCDGLVVDTLAAVDEAIDEEEDDQGAEPPPPAATVKDDGVEEGVEVQAEVDEDRSTQNAVKNLLDRLLYKGILPRYAFPTDVATFYVFNAAESTRFRPAFSYTPSQGLAIALSQYAPGKEVWVANRRFTSGAIYSPYRGERARAWREKQLYFECTVCHYARTLSTTQASRGDRLNCEACGGVNTFGAGRHWLRPPGFAHPVNKPEVVAADEPPAKSYATRAKLIAPGPPEVSQWSRVNDRIRAHHLRKPLIVTNRGPREEGYTYCTLCGLVAPSAAPQGLLLGAHEKPYPDPTDQTCPGGRIAKGIVFGTDFITDVLLVSITVDRPLTLRPGLLGTDVSLRTLCEALTRAACGMLGLEPGELQAEYRPALSGGGQSGLEAELYLYDTLAGGAGFARRVQDLGVVVFEEALAILEGCPADCDRSCYRCLRSYKNKFEHDLLDRHIAASLLRFLLDGTEPALSAARERASTDRLFEDLRRQRLHGVTVERDAVWDDPAVGRVTAPILARRKDGRALIVAVANPLTPDHHPDPSIRAVKEYGATPPLIQDELIVRRNLPRATSDLLDRLGGGTP